MDTKISEVLLLTVEGKPVGRLTLRRNKESYLKYELVEFRAYGYAPLTITLSKDSTIEARELYDSLRHYWYDVTVYNTEDAYKVMDEKISSINKALNSVEYLKKSTMTYKGCYTKSNIIVVSVPKCKPQEFYNINAAISYIEEMFNYYGNSNITINDFIDNITMKGNMEYIANIWAYLQSKYNNAIITYKEIASEYKLGNLERL